jgi:hypothetical protein
MSGRQHPLGNTSWKACVRAVDNGSVVHGRRTTRLQDVVRHGLPVHSTRLVYAGKRRGYPQSTALITAIDMHTSDGTNMPIPSPTRKPS